jgi:hypothetical protein
VAGQVACRCRAAAAAAAALPGGGEGRAGLEAGSWHHRFRGQPQAKLPTGDGDVVGAPGHSLIFGIWLIWACRQEDGILEFLLGCLPQRRRQQGQQRGRRQQQRSVPAAGGWRRCWVSNGGMCSAAGVRCSRMQGRWRGCRQRRAVCMRQLRGAAHGSSCAPGKHGS